MSIRKLNKDNLIKRINQILSDNEQMINGQTYKATLVESSIFGTISILNLCYGENCQQIKSLIKLRESYTQSTTYKVHHAYDIKTLIQGILNSLKSDVEFSLLNSIEDQTAGEIYGDFLSLAKRLINEGHKESAAVLACGALEDSMKKFAIKNDIDAYESELNQVVNSLKAKGLIKGTQAGVVQSYVTLRNKAFHAQFDKIELPEIASLIAFVETFLLETFG